MNAYANNAGHYILSDEKEILEIIKEAVSEFCGETIESDKGRYIVVQLAKVENINNTRNLIEKMYKVFVEETKDGLEMLRYEEWDGIEKISLKDYKKDCVCTYDEYGNVLILHTDEIDEIKKYISLGKQIYGTIKKPIFTKHIVEEIKDYLKDYADDEGYDDVNDFIDYDNENFNKVEEALKNWINNLGEENNVYLLDKYTVINL